MAFNINYLELEMKPDGSFHNGDLIIKKNGENMPANILFLTIDYYNYGKFLPRDVISRIKLDNYRVHNTDATLSFIDFINNNCDYKIYLYHNNVFHTHYFDEEGEIEEITVENMVTKINSPCIIRDPCRVIRKYDLLENTDPLRLRYEMIQVAKIYEHFILKPVIYYNQHKGLKDNIDQPYGNGYYVMDAKKNFVTKSAVNVVTHK